MKKSELSRRISRLEGCGFAPAAIRLAFRNFMQHSITHRNPRLARIVADLAGALGAMDASVPSSPPQSAEARP